MFPGHFKIVGHSGTEFKHRKAFKKLKKSNQTAMFKYGEEYGQYDFKIDKERMASAEEEKKRKLLINGILFFGLICIVAVVSNYFLERYLSGLPPIIQEAKYEWQVHGSEGVLRDIKYQETIKAGYLAWEQGDYDKAIDCFEKIAVDSMYWYKKEYALLSLYHDCCNDSGDYCDKYEVSRRELKDDDGKLIRDDYEEQFFKYVFQYNRNMIAYYKTSKSTQPIN